MNSPIKVCNIKALNVKDSLALPPTSITSNLSSNLLKNNEDLLTDALFRPQSILVGDLNNSPIDNVRRLLELTNKKQKQKQKQQVKQQQIKIQKKSTTVFNGTNNGDTPAPNQIFCEMLYLTTDIDENDLDLLKSNQALNFTQLVNSDRLINNSTDFKIDYTNENLNVENVTASLFWQQTARWIKYEQQVEGDGTRFSKPHITLLTIHSLLQVKNCLRKGVVLLDLDVSSYIELCNRIIDAWDLDGFLDNENKASKEEQISLIKDVLYAPKLHLIRGKMRKINEMIIDTRFPNRQESNFSGLYDMNHTSFVKEFSDSDEESTKYEDADERLMKRLSTETDAAVVLIANVHGLEKSLTTFVRLARPTLMYPEIPDHPIPIRFIFVLMHPADNFVNEATGIGRVMGALFSDEIFQRVVYSATKKTHIADSVEEFLSQSIIIPPGKCNIEARWEPREMEIATCRNVGMIYANFSGNYCQKHLNNMQNKKNCKQKKLSNEVVSCECPVLNTSDSETTEDFLMRRLMDRKQRIRRRLITKTLCESNNRPAIARSGQCFGGLLKDWFHSDFLDFFETRLSKCLAATMTIFFANLAQIITFAGVMERALHQQMGAIENIVGGGLCGVFFGFFAGQPLIILSATGPTLIFERVLYEFCTAYQWEFLPFRFYVGVWMAFFLLILVATDASALVGLITRFTEEGFAALISICFIIQAFEKLYEVSYEPITTRSEETFRATCHCLLKIMTPSNGTSLSQTIIKNISIGVRRCHDLGGVPQGTRCFFKPDVYMFSVLLAFGTFMIAYFCNNFHRSRYFTFKIRSVISDFGLIIAIIVMTIITHVLRLEVSILKVPSNLRPTLERSWLIDVTDIAGIEAILFALLPAFFYTILIVMDQQITAVIVNRAHNKLKKGGGYHLDLFVLMILILMCSLLGLPFYVAATVLSATHMDSLKFYSYSCAAPGVKPKFLGIKEQRMSNILTHILIGSSIFITPLLQLVPLPVLTGIFLYMGVVSLIGQQFTRRIALIFMTIKYQPDYKWLRAVQIKRVHLFTLIQFLSLTALFAIRYASTFSMVFPLMLVVMVFIRLHIVQRIFTGKELQALDDNLPSFNEVWQPRSTTQENAITQRILAAATSSFRNSKIEESLPLQQFEKKESIECQKK